MVLPARQTLSSYLSFTISIILSTKFLLLFNFVRIMVENWTQNMSKQLSVANHFFFRGCLFGIYIISSACLALRVRSCVYQCVDKHVLALQIAECFVGMTIPISVYHAWEHLTNFVKPRLQSQIVRIIWIVPIYSLECLLSIQFMEHAFYFQAIREIYESYVIYCFMR